MYNSKLKKIIPLTEVFVIVHPLNEAALVRFQGAVDDGSDAGVFGVFQAGVVPFSEGARVALQHVILA